MNSPAPVLELPVVESRGSPRRRRPLDKDFTGSSRYHNAFLFDWSGPEIIKCLDRLRLQATVYRDGSVTLRRRMQVRALFTAALTLNASAVWTAKLLARGTFAMGTQRRFFMKRYRQNPGDWGVTAKSCFARALSGFSMGPDGVCIDRHLERMDLAPKNAAQQWRDWFRLYESLYGPGETSLCARWHIELLGWIATQSQKPEPWK